MTSEDTSKKRVKDIRTLCYRCASEMINAGIRLYATGGTKSKCDKCNKPGSDYVVK